MECTEVVHHLNSMIVGLVLLAAGVAKLRSPMGASGDVLAQLTVLPAWIRRVVAGLLPFIEIGAGGLLLFNAGWWWVSVFVVAMLGFFTLTVVTLRLSGKSVRCACFGGGDPEEIHFGLFLSRNFVLMLMAMAGRSSDVRSLTATEFFLSVGISLVLMASYVLISTHASLHSVAPPAMPSPLPRKHPLTGEMSA